MFYLNKHLFISFFILLVILSGCIKDNNSKLPPVPNEILAPTSTPTENPEDFDNLVTIENNAYNPANNQKKSLSVEMDTYYQVLNLDVSESGRSGGPEILRTLHNCPHDFVSAAILSAKGKQFDDGLYAAVELAIQNGTDNISSKKEFLSAVYDSLSDQNDGSTLDYSKAFILSASEFGGQTLESDKDVLSLSQGLNKGFLWTEVLSNPVGFYTWNAELEDIFQQDRFLQTLLASPFPLTDPVPICKAICDSHNGDYYSNYLELVEKMTNPFIKTNPLIKGEVSDLRPIINDLSSGKKLSLKDTYVFFPPSRSYESDLLNKLYGNSVVPPDFSLSDKLIAEIKSGRIDLRPKENSGWYDYQTYSLEPLVLPEYTQ